MDAFIVFIKQDQVKFKKVENTLDKGHNIRKLFLVDQGAPTRSDPPVL